MILRKTSVNICKVCEQSELRPKPLQSKGFVLCKTQCSHDLKEVVTQRMAAINSDRLHVPQFKFTQKGIFSLEKKKFALRGFLEGLLSVSYNYPKHDRYHAA